MANKEARLEFDAKEARDLVKDVAKDAADQVKKAEEALAQGPGRTQQAVPRPRTPAPRRRRPPRN